MKNKWTYIIGCPLAIGLAYLVLLAYYPALDALLLLLKGLLMLSGIALTILICYIINCIERSENNDEADIW